jgi:hypothetical protein
MSFNCLILGTNNLYPIVIAEVDKQKFVNLGKQNYPLNLFTGLLLRKYICEMENVTNFNDMKLLKANNVKMSDIIDQNISTEDDVKNKLNGEEMELVLLFKRYFVDELKRADSQDGEVAENIHVIAIINPTTGKCLPMFYLSNKKFAVTKYRFGLISFFSR